MFRRGRQLRAQSVRVRPGLCAGHDRQGGSRDARRVEEQRQCQVKRIQSGGAMPGAGQLLLKGFSASAPYFIGKRQCLHIFLIE